MEASFEHARLQMERGACVCLDADPKAITTVSVTAQCPSNNEYIQCHAHV